PEISLRHGRKLGQVRLECPLMTQSGYLRPWSLSAPSLPMAAEDRLTVAITSILAERDCGYGYRSSCCFHRLCHCNHHHHHGAGIEGAARRRLDRACYTASAFRQLRFKLHLSGDLLEQPSPSSSYRDTGRWPHSLDQFIFAVLPISHPGCDSLDG